MAKKTLHCFVLLFSVFRSIDSSKQHSIIVAPPKQFLKPYTNVNHKYTNAFHKDALRDRKLFGFSDYNSENRKVINTHQSIRPDLKPLNVKQRPSYSKISRALEATKKLGGFKKRPKYTNIDRQKPEKDFLDASRFDDDYDDLIFIDTVNHNVHLPIFILLAKPISS